jgi:hypothetical protein
MFKAVHKSTHQEIIAIAPEWAEQIDTLRVFDRDNLLICQGCKQPVRLKAGQVRIHHFAHKSLGTCTYGKESPALLMARALLYQHLHTVFGGAVTLEKRFEDKRFPRTVDCWVEREGITPIAYWIVENRIRPQVRDALRSALESTGAQIQWVFTAEMLRPFEEHQSRLLLSTTERDLAVKTVFDAEISEGSIWRGQTLHYLLQKESALATYRGLRCIHEPEVYQGRKLVHSISEILIAPKTGEFAHPGERERLAAIEAEKKRLEEERLQREQARLQREAEEHAAILARIEAAAHAQGKSVSFDTTAVLSNSSTTSPHTTPEKPSYSFEAKAGVCVHCGQRTHYWWTYHMGTCKCYECREKGLN